MATLSATDQTRETLSSLFQRQREYAPVLARTNARERLERLDRIERYLRDRRHQEQLFTAMQHDLHKPKAEVLLSETGVIFTHLAYVRRRLRRWMRPRPVSGTLPLIGARSYIRCEPKGVTLILAPWNYPLNLAIYPLIYAIAAGNTAVVKPSEMAPHTSAFIEAMLTELFESRAVAVVQGDGNVAQLLLEQPFNHVHFTGSPRNGKKVMSAAAQHLSSVTLELGGKSPALIDDTANIKAVTERLAWGKCFNMGQTCIAPDYALVHESAQDAFVEHYRRTIERFFNPADAGAHQSPDYGRVINDDHFRRLKRLFDDAVDRGATVLTGGQFIDSERYIAPTLLFGVTEEMDIMQEEIFGPLLPLLTYREPADALAIINRRPKPLTMYIGSRNRNRIRRYLTETSAGGTVVNDFLLGYGNPGLPFGGVNNSGIGKSMGYHGFAAFSNERSIIHRRWGTLRFVYPPYHSWLHRFLDWLF